MTATVMQFVARALGIADYPPPDPALWARLCQRWPELRDVG